MTILQYVPGAAAQWVDCLSWGWLVVLLVAAAECYRRFKRRVAQRVARPREAQRSCLLAWAAWLVGTGVLFFVEQFVAGTLRDSA